ncbi:MAG: hypothetical protein HN392_13945 [Anaerolineae bacterium]|jgi:hypothetical protein|nr:hypothetical protein [Anaerolineae bacterium]MBT7075199.1 hypothetical protein [Anaerolineae bacterium]MBT7783847.1 hypothetical protein [Anaerolineae bacterium]
MTYDEKEVLGCVSTQAFLDLINACKNSEQKILDLIPAQTEFMRLQIFPINAEGTEKEVFFDANWADVKNYVNKSLSAEEFKTGVRIFTLCSP